MIETIVGLVTIGIIWPTIDALSDRFERCAAITLWIVGLLVVSKFTGRAVGHLLSAVIG